MDDSNRPKYVHYLEQQQINYNWHESFNYLLKDVSANTLLLQNKKKPQKKSCNIILDERILEELGNKEDS